MMKDYVVPINDVDALIAHFAEWVKFLEAKGKELEAQLAKLEAKKTKASIPAPVIPPTSDSTTSSLPPDETGEKDFLDIVFQAQAENRPDDHTHDLPLPEKASNEVYAENVGTGLVGEGSEPYATKKLVQGDALSLIEAPLASDPELR